MTELVTTGDAIRERTTCRLCESGDLVRVLSLTPTPPANAFVPPSTAGVLQQSFPLDVVQCGHCGHVQLRHVLDPHVLFADYVYVSGTAASFVQHFHSYAEQVLSEFAPKLDAFVVDIGSNDGTLLRAFQRAGCRVLGVDPAREIARRATDSGVETIPDFFTPALAREIRGSRGRAGVVTANNVFAHVDDLGAVVDGVRELLDERGVFVFEVSYLVDLYDKSLFDLIYHEHLDYHTVRPLIPFFARHGLELVEAFRVETHGGSLRGVAQHKGGPRRVGESLSERTSEEASRRLEDPEVLRAFSRRIDRLRDELRQLLLNLRAEGSRLAGYGAPAKSTTLLHHFGIDADMLEFIVDDSPLKQGLLSPGLHIPIASADVLYERRPDHLVVLAWNFATQIMQKHHRFRDEGGHFVVPLPEVRVH